MPLIDLGSRGTCLRKDALVAFGRRRVRTALSLGEAVSPWPNVLVDATRAAEPLTYLTAAWLAVGPDALVSGPSAAYLHGLTALPPTPVHLVVPYEHRKRARDGIVIHNASGLDDDRDERQGLPVLNLERVVVDLLCTAWPPKALAVLDEALARLPESDRPAFRRRLRERLQERPDPRGTRIGTRLVDLATGRAESPPESWLLWMVVDLGFPRARGQSSCPRCQRAARCTASTSATTKCGSPSSTTVTPPTRSATRRDAARLRDLERRGWIVIVVDVDDLHGPARLEKELHEAFLLRGVVLGARDGTRAAAAPASPHSLSQASSNVRGWPPSGPHRDIRGPICTDSRAPPGRGWAPTWANAERGMRGTAGAVRRGGGRRFRGGRGLPRRGRLGSGRPRPAPGRPPPRRRAPAGRRPPRRGSTGAGRRPRGRRMRGR